ncbi:MAG: hypothetical protein OER88_10010, partial [Planctomycetota bacterium]|nr:hypothetical protein [Planctomycetota bacterium]
QKASHAYGEIVRRKIDPALLEWAGAGVFRARVFPLAGKKLHRMVLGYEVNLTSIDDRLEYRLDLPETVPALAVHIRAENGGGDWHNPKQRTFTASTTVKGATLLQGNEYFAVLARPELPKRPAQPVAQAVFLLDASLSGNPERFNVWLKLLEQILTRNRGTLKEFAVLVFNVEAYWWRPGMTPNTEQHVRALLRDARKLALEGATDLGLALQTARERPGDLFLLGDGAGTWGEADPYAIARQLPPGRALFSYNTGFSGTDTKTMNFLARESGGAVFSVTGEAEVAAVAVAHTFRPWTLDAMTVEGGRDLLAAGRPRTIFPGQNLYVAGRGRAKGPLRLTLGDRTIEVPFAQTHESELAAGVFGQIAVGQLEELELTDTARPFALHFRVVGKTCSLLMLETEEDYEEFGIVAEDDAGTVRKTDVSAVIKSALASIGDSLSNPKKRFLAWLDSLDDLPVEFSFPAEARANLEALPVEAFVVAPDELTCTVRRWNQIPGRIQEELASRKLTYDSLTKEAERREQPADRLKALSSLVENRPGDLALQRDIGYTALAWGLGGQAYWLFRRVADARPYEPHSYHAMALCLLKMGKRDLADAYYEIALAGQWPERYGEFRDIVAVDCRRADRAPADLIVTIAWNTDRTDIDLHVIDPNQEECYYKHKKTSIGGAITKDVTGGFGPEMFTLRKAIPGTYQVKVKYFAEDTTRASARTKVYVTIHEDWGRPTQRTRREVVTLAYGKKMHTVAEIKR